MEKDDEARSAALVLLARGQITPGQAAELAGVSRQLVAYWLRQANIDWRKASDRRIAGVWRKQIAALNGKILRPPTKRQLRKIADRALKQWSKRNGKAPATPARQSGPAGKSCSSTRPPA